MAAADSSSPLFQAERRAWSYWFVDGLPNLVAGLICIFLASGFMLFSHYRHSKSPFVFIVAALATAFYIVVFARLRQTIEWLKARITYPRTGYATSPYFTFGQEGQPPTDLTMLNLSKVDNPGVLPSAAEAAREVQDRHWRLWLALVIYVAAMLSAGLIHQRGICGLLGVAAGMGILLITRKNERMLWAAAFALPFAGMYTFLVGGQSPHVRIEKLGFFLAGAGFVLALDGAIALIRYLRSNPVARA